jgi:6-phosphogluconolactonase
LIVLAGTSLVYRADVVASRIGDARALAVYLGEEIAALTAGAASERRPLALAISGGSVATTFFPAWAAGRVVDWTSTHVFWADERAVAPTDPESNYGLARSLWLDPAGAPATSIHRMPADEPDLEQAARDYADTIARVVGPAGVLDLVLLGIGPDGHVASLFPGHVLLTETSRGVAAVTDSPKPPPRRLTLTLPLLTTARAVVIGAFGAGKAAIVREAVTDPASRLPAALVARGARRAIWLLDPGAASEL